jgi:hypothetical protein
MKIRVVAYAADGPNLPSIKHVKKKVFSPYVPFVDGAPALFCQSVFTP